MRVLSTRFAFPFSRDTGFPCLGFFFFCINRALRNVRRVLFFLFLSSFREPSVNGGQLERALPFLLRLVSFSQSISFFCLFSFNRTFLPSGTCVWCSIEDVFGFFLSLLLETDRALPSGKQIPPIRIEPSSSPLLLCCSLSLWQNVWVSGCRLLFTSSLYCSNPCRTPHCNLFLSVSVLLSPNCE